MRKIYLMNFLLAMSTTVGMTIIPILSVEFVGISVFLFSLIEAFGELLSNLLKFASGYFFDRLKKKKKLFLLSTLFALFSKLLLTIPSIYTLITTKLLERLGNGSFATPRDAYIGLLSSKKGKSLGILNSFRAVGCVFGSFLTSFYLSQNLNLNLILHLIFFCSAICFICFLISFLLPDLKVKTHNIEESEKISVFKILQENKSVYILVFLFFCARFNDGLILLFLKSKEIEPWFYLSTIGIFNSIAFCVSPFIGAGLDSTRKRKVISFCILSLFTFNLIFAFVKNLTIYIAFFALALWGCQRVGSQVMFTTLVFDRVKKDDYGTACGLMNIFIAAGNFFASVCCGYLSSYNFELVFVFSGLFSFASLLFFYKKIS